MSGLLFASGAAVITVGTAVYWMGLINRVALAERRWVVNVLLGATIVLSLAAFEQGVGVLGSSLAGLSLAVGVIYFGLLTLAGQSTQASSLAVGTPLPQFTAPDHDGNPFSLSSLAGHPVLLKLFRGHW